MSFLSEWFRWGLLAAAGPVLIHLLNRTRRRTIHWAAMEFLRDAIRRNRRVLRLRDIILLILRTAAVVLFVLAMARPFWSAGQDDAVGDEPMHAVLVMDNSLSMGYTPVKGSLLDLAKAKAKAFIERLPKGSDISVIPLCSDSPLHDRDVYSTKEDALEAVDRIEIVDRSASLQTGFARAQQACKLASEIPTKRVVFVGDAQRNSWDFGGAESYADGIGDIQVVQVAQPKRTNSWVASFKLLHGLADAESTAVFRAVIRHEGDPRTNVRVTLKIDGKVMDDSHEKLVNLESGSTLSLDFRHKFNVAGTSAEPLFVSATLELAPDQLTQDDFRALIVPVVARVPIVFIDQYGSDERPDENLFGETARVRRLVSSSVAAPATAGEAPEFVSSKKQLVEVRQRTIDRVTRDDLKDARLVVLAGVKAPTPSAVQLLREYVEQGGQLFLAAGGEFEPALWTAVAWQEGAGILPVPLAPGFLGRVPQPHEANAPSFRLDADSIVGEALHFDATPRERKEILETPRIFQAVLAEMDKPVLGAFALAEAKRVQQHRDWVGRYDENERRWAEMERKGTLSDADKAQRERDRLQAATFSPNWLAWSNPLARDLGELSVEDRVKRAMPQVVGRYGNEQPFAVQRDVGKGRIVMLTTGLWPRWNTLALENSVLLLDRIMRSMLVHSLPDRTFGPESEIVIPVAASDQGVDFKLDPPGQEPPRLQSVEALGNRTYGLMLRSIQQRGVYQIFREDPTQTDPGARPDRPAFLLAVNGDQAESELASLRETDLPKTIGASSPRWVGPDKDIALTGKTYIDPNFWKVLMGAALGCVLLEMLLLWGWRGRGRPTV